MRRKLGKGGGVAPLEGSILVPCAERFSSCLYFKNSGGGSGRTEGGDAGDRCAVAALQSCSTTTASTERIGMRERRVCGCMPGP